MNVVSSPYASERIAAADDWLAARSRGRLIVCSATLGAAAEALRRLAARVGAGAGWQRTTPGRLAATLAGPRMAALGLAPAGALTVQALCARILHEGHAAGTRLAAVADRPGLSPALARTLQELRLAGAEPPPDLAPLARAFERALLAFGLADRATIFALATEAAAGESPLLGASLCLLDVTPSSPREAAFLDAVAARAPDALAVRPTAPGAALLRAALEVFSSADEAREHVEVVRRILGEAAAGTPFDRMAVLFRAASASAPLVEALGRAGIPTFHAAGRPVPDPAGRAFLALLSCAEEGLSARRFAEYLSLGEIAPPAPSGAPRAPSPPAERWSPADDEVFPGGFATGDDGQSPSSLPRGDAEEPPGPVAPAPLSTARWEGLLVEAGIFDGHDRWRRRLYGLEAKIALELRDGSEPRAERARRRIEDVRALRAFALPLIDDLAALPRRAPWGEWLSRLSALATRALRRPDRVLSLLAELSPMAPVGPVGLPEVRLVLHRRVAALHAPSEGPRAGRLLVGPIDAARGRAFDAVFLTGVAEKVFPPKLVDDPLLSDETGTRRAERAAAERLLLQLAAGAAERRLVASYPRLEEGRARVPSIYLQELVAAAEGRIPGAAELHARAEQAGAAPGEPIDAAEYDLRAIAAAQGGSARYLLSASPHLERALRVRARRWLRNWNPADGLVRPSPEAAAVLERHRLSARSYSATALQRYAACPYQFFLQAIHRLAPREEPERPGEMDPLTRGSLVHDVLCDFLTELREAGLLPITASAAAEARLDRVLDETAAQYREELAPAVERVWDDGVAAIRVDLHEWLVRFAADRAFSPLRFELAFGIEPRDPDSRIEPAPLDSGLQLRGAIDLVERDADGTLRATDYKTGKVRANRGAVMQGGEILQPILYALALEKLYPGSKVWGGRLHHITRAAGFEAVEIPLDEAARRAADLVAAVVGESIDQGFFPAAPKPGACRFCDYVQVCGPHEEVRAARKPPLPRLEEIRRWR